MKNILRYSTLTAACAAALMVAAPTFAAGPYNYDVGNLGDANTYNEVVRITPQTRWVNVSQGDMVKFVDERTGNSFVWDFDTTGITHFDLSMVAPPGVMDGEHVIVYVAEQSRDES